MFLFEENNDDGEKDSEVDDERDSSFEFTINIKDVLIIKKQRVT